MQSFSNKEFSIAEFAESIECSYMDNDIMFARIHDGNIHQFNNIAEDMFLPRSKNNTINSILVLSGEITATIDYIKYKIGDRSILGIHPFRVLTELKASDHFNGYILICSKEFLDETILDKRPVSLSQILFSNKTPNQTYSSAELEVIKTSMERIEYYLKQENHRLKKEIIHNALYNYILESLNFILAHETKGGAPAKTSNKETFVHKFVGLLIEHGDREHNPSFYADKLCISVQYLSLILKEVSGETANAWISGYLITRIKVLLRKPDMTIQQITEIVNFSDQSSLGKFFKKHVGIPPKKYKEKYTAY